MYPRAGTIGSWLDLESDVVPCLHTWLEHECPRILRATHLGPGPTSKPVHLVHCLLPPKNAAYVSHKPGLDKTSSHVIWLKGAHIHWTSLDCDLWYVFSTTSTILSSVSDGSCLGPTAAPYLGAGSRWRWLRICHIWQQSRIRTSQA